VAVALASALKSLAPGVRNMLANSLVCIARVQEVEAACTRTSKL
jgi:hypothetical protein